MSFSSTAKGELCHIKIKRDCCKLAALGAWIRICGSLQIGSNKQKKLRLKTESYLVARWGVQIAKSLFNVEAEIYVKERKRLGKMRSFAILLGGENISELLYAIGWLKEVEGSTMIVEGAPWELLEKDCCKRAFLRGIFIGAGSMSAPEKGYHLEMVVKNDQLAEDIQKLLNEFELNAKVVIRKANNVLYLKESDKIAEFLTLIGAHSAILDFQSVKVYKDFRNNLNRQVNCETANIQKTVTAAARQIQSIKYLIQNNTLDFLSPELRETAEIRINNPEATLIEMAQLLSVNVGKSGVNHRLRKLDEIANEMRIEKGDL